MSHTISTVKIRTVSVPLREPFAIATESMAACPHVIVEIETRDGIMGLGVVSTIPSFMGETADGVVAGVRFLGERVRGLDAFDIEVIVERMDAALAGSHTAKAAIDFACHDIMGKALNLPVHKLIGGLCRERIACTWVIGIKDVHATLDEAVLRYAEGYRVLKIKIGRDENEDLDKVRLVRETLGAEARIRLDANTAYTVDRAVRILSRLERYDLEMIEQPCRKADLAAMARVRNTLATPILADESAMGPEEVLHLIEAGAADIINIKLAKVGGIHKARKVAGLAAAAGLPVVVGSNMELGPGVAAGAHFAAATANVTYACDLYAGVQLHQYDLGADVWDRRGMTIAVPRSPGLGVGLKALERLHLKSEGSDGLPASGAGQASTRV